MFKALILSLALAASGHATVSGTTPIENLNSGITGLPNGALTYALNNALTGTSSSAVDLSGTAGLWLTLTSTASANVLVYFSNSNVTYTTGAAQMYILTSPGSYAISPKARYVSFYNGATQAATRVSASYYSLWNGTIAGGTTTVNGTVTANQGTAGSAAWPVYLTQPALSSSYVYASATAELVTTAGLAVNISSVAGASCADCRLYWSTRDAAGVYWDYGTTANGGAGTIPTTLGHFTAASVTATLDDGFIDGQLIYFKSPSGSVNTFVTVRKKQ